MRGSCSAPDTEGSAAAFIRAGQCDETMRIFGRTAACMQRKLEWRLSSMQHACHELSTAAAAHLAAVLDQLDGLQRGNRLLLLPVAADVVAAAQLKTGRQMQACFRALET